MKKIEIGMRKGEGRKDRYQLILSTWAGVGAGTVGRSQSTFPQMDNSSLGESGLVITPPLTLAGVGSGEGGEITKLDVSANRLLWCTSRCRCRDTESC